MHYVIIYLWASLAFACALNHMADPEIQKAHPFAKYGSAVLVAIIGPPLIPLILFNAMLNFVDLLTLGVGFVRSEQARATAMPQFWAFQPTPEEKNQSRWSN